MGARNLRMAVCPDLASQDADLRANCMRAIPNCFEDWLGSHSTEPHLSPIVMNDLMTCVGLCNGKMVVKTRNGITIDTISSFQIQFRGNLLRVWDLTTIGVANMLKKAWRHPDATKFDAVGNVLHLWGQ
jgi:hypothetical protein